MKKIVITIILARSSLFGFGQSDEIKKERKIQFGFN